MGRGAERLSQENVRKISGDVASLAARCQALWHELLAVKPADLARNGDKLTPKLLELLRTQETLAHARRNGRLSAGDTQRVTAIELMILKEELGSDVLRWLGPHRLERIAA